MKLCANDIELTISKLKNRYQKNGSLGTFVDDLEEVRKEAVGKDKNDCPVIMPFVGERGVYNPSNIFFVDIDTNYKVDDIIEDRQNLFSKCPNIVCLQKSSSGNLHIIGTHGDVIEDADTWEIETKYQTAAINETLYRLYNVDYTEYVDEKKGVIALDNHNTKYTQLFYVNSNVIYTNEYVGGVCLTKQQRNFLQDKYKNTFDFTVKQITPKYNKNTNSGVLEEYTGEKVCINTELVEKEFPAQYGEKKWTGNDLRWRISIIAYNLFGDDAKSWCDERFYYDRGRSIYSIPSDKSKRVDNIFVLTWLTSKGYLKIESKRDSNEFNSKTIEMETEYLSPYLSVIKDYIGKTSVLSIEAPTGAGKTTLLNELTGLYKESVVVVPFNVTNNLYKKLNIYSSEITDSKYKEGKANCCIWDKFNRIADDIYPEVVFVDESHTLALDQTYRDAAVKTIEKLQNMVVKGVKVVFISATPCFEVQLFNAFQLKFVKKDNRDVKVEVRFTNDTAGCIKNDVKNVRESWDKICVFSDRDTKQQYINCLTNNIKSTIYHSDFRENVKQLRDTEMIEDKINFFTCIAFNGLNIRNKGEKILIDIRYTRGETTLNAIKQIVGRFRNNEDITVRIYVDNKYETELNLEEAFENAKVIVESGSVELISSYWERLNDSNVQNALKRIESYVSTQTVEYVVAELSKEYNVKLMKQYTEEKIERVDPRKREQSERFKQYIAGKNVQINDDDEYINDWLKRMRKIKNEYMIEVENLLRMMLKVNPKATNKLVSTILDEIERICYINTLSDESWKAEVEKRDAVIKGVKGQTLKAVLRTFKKDDFYREKYKDVCLENAIVDYLDETMKEFLGIIEERKESGKKGGKVGKKVKDTKTGKVFDSVQKAAKFYGKHTDTITSWIKKGRLVEVVDN